MQLPVLVQSAAVRQAVSDTLCGCPSVCLQGTDVFESRLLDVFLTLLQDQVNAVRMAATQSLRSLAKYLGTAWIRARLLPRLNARLVDRAASTYLQRITVLYAVRDVVTAPACADISDAFLPLLLTSFEDDVPNVQFVAVQAAAAALDAGTLTRAQIAEVHAALLKMGNTSKLDVDVRYFTEIALSKCA
ncbi:hypothetical protein EON66_04060 [archaeon]|nr:MAG: hypothetical protein EON66_04060 [archaeon]